MLKLRYFADILALDNSQVRVNIYKDTDGVVVAEEVQLLPDGLMIEHKDTDKLEPIQSSSLTLKLNSATNFQFLELYSLQDGSFIVEVLRNNALIWSGVLDSNLYEEPLNYHENYDVQVTASTFGILDRKALRTVEGNKLSGTITLPELIIEALKVSKLRFNNLYFGATMTTEASSTIADLYFDSGVFEYHDDKCTWLKALEDALKPFALTLRYINGNVYVHDIYTALLTGRIIQRWDNTFKKLPDASIADFTPIDLDALGFDGAEHLVSFDKVLNNIEVEFKPAIQNDLIELEVGEKLDGSVYLSTVMVESGSQLIGFNANAYRNAPKSTLISNGVGNYVKFEDFYSNAGNDTCIIVPTQYNNGNIIAPLNYSQLWGNLPAEQKRNITNNTQGKYVYVEQGLKNRIKIDANIMFDTRYNPFEADGVGNEEGNTNRMAKTLRVLMIPVNIYLTDGKGNVTYVYSNKNVRRNTSNNPYAYSGEWLKYSTKIPYESCLYYYDQTNPNENVAVKSGWNNCKKEITSNMIFSDNWAKGVGNFGKVPSLKNYDFTICLPPESGYLHVEYLSGYGNYYRLGQNELDFTKMRWLGYKDIKVSILDQWDREINDDDYVYNSWVNQQAYEEESVKTILGSNTDSTTSALGNIYGTVSGKQKIITQFSKGENLKKPLEELLISSYYSNYYDRSLIIKAEVNATINGIIFTYNKVFPNKKFLIRENETNLYEATSNLTITEVKKDSFTLTKIDEKYE